MIIYSLNLSEHMQQLKYFYLYIYKKLPSFHSSNEEVLAESSYLFCTKFLKNVLKKVSYYCENH